MDIVDRLRVSIPETDFAARIEAANLIERMRGQLAAEQEGRRRLLGPRAMTYDIESLRADAARWSALMSSERVTAMGWSGFDTRTDEPKAHDPYLHVTLNFWNKHPPETGWQGKHGRKMLLAYVDGILALEKKS